LEDKTNIIGRYLLKNTQLVEYIYDFYVNRVLRRY